MGQREGVCNVMGSQSKASRKEWQEIVCRFLEDDVLVKANPPPLVECIRRQG
jgi:hypothetical protein